MLDKLGGGVFSRLILLCLLLRWGGNRILLPHIISHTLLLSFIFNYYRFIGGCEGGDISIEDIQVGEGYSHGDRIDGR